MDMWITKKRGDGLELFRLARLQLLSVAKLSLLQSLPCLQQYLPLVCHSSRINIYLGSLVLAP